MILFYDTETTGLPDSRLPSDDPGQPKLVQLGLIACTEAGNEVSSAELIVKPDGWAVPEGAARVHGITTEIAMALGLPLLTVLSVFVNMRANAGELVTYNLPFDETIMAAAIARGGKKPSHPGPDRRTCCMSLATPVVGLPPTDRMRAAGFDKNKPPSLTEAYRFFFGRDFPGAHQALADCRAAKEIYFEMKRREAAGAPF